MEPAKLQRANGDADYYVVMGREWNKMCERVEALDFEVGAPLALQKNPAGGRLLTLSITNMVTPLHLTAVETAGGFYKARTLYGSVQITTPTTFALPQGLTDQSADDALVMYLPEAGSSAHALSTSGPSSYGAGLFVGMTQEATPRKAMIWLGAAPAVVYLKVSANWSQSINNGNFIKGHVCDATGSSASSNTTNIHLVWPYGDKVQFSPLQTNDVIAWMPTGTSSAGTNVIAGLALPTRQVPLFITNRTYLTGLGSGSTKTLAWDYVRAASV